MQALAVDAKTVLPVKRRSSGRQPLSESNGDLFTQSFKISKRVESVILTYGLSKRDYVQFGLYTTLYSREAKQKRRKVTLQSVLIVGLLILIILTRGFSIGGPVQVTILAVLAAAFGLFVYLVPVYQNRMIFENIAAHPDNHSIFSEQLYDFSEKGIALTDEQEQVFMKWSAIVSKHETSEYFYLYKSTQQAIIIPKQKFENAEKLNSFRILLSKHLSLEADKMPPDLK